MFVFSFQHTPRFSRILWFSNTSSSSSLWFSRAKVPKGRRASCCRRPPFSRHSILSLCCPNLLLTSLLHRASRLPSSTPLSAHMPFTPPSTMPKLSLSSSLPSTYKSSQRYVHKRRLMPHTKELEDRIFLGCENAASLTQMGSLPINKRLYQVKNSTDHFSRRLLMLYLIVSCLFAMTVVGTHIKHGHYFK